MSRSESSPTEKTITAPLIPFVRFATGLWRPHRRSRSLRQASANMFAERMIFCRRSQSLKIKSKDALRPT
jgi:hypothetical protein